MAKKEATRPKPVNKCVHQRKKSTIKLFQNSSKSRGLVLFVYDLFVNMRIYKLYL